MGSGIDKHALVGTQRLFEYSPRYFLLVHSLSHGLPSVARFTLGCVPIFMVRSSFLFWLSVFLPSCLLVFLKQVSKKHDRAGQAYVGAATIFFGRQSQSFGSIGETVTTLFSLLNGDTMLDTFDSIGPASQWGSGVGRLFLGSFISESSNGLPPSSYQRSSDADCCRGQCFSVTRC